MDTNRHPDTASCSSEEVRHTAASELAAQLSDCASLLPSLRAHLRCSLEQLRASIPFPNKEGSNGIHSGLCVAERSAKDRIREKDIIADLQKVDGQEATVTIFILADKIVSLVVSFSFFDGFSIVEGASGVKKENEKCYESLISLLLDTGLFSN